MIKSIFQWTLKKRFSFPDLIALFIAIQVYESGAYAAAVTVFVIGMLVISVAEVLTGVDQREGKDE